MYGCFVVSPNDSGADLGVVFFHNAGYSTACGHGTIALVTWALDQGVVERREGENHVVVDVPSGRLETWAHVEGGRVRSVRFRNVPAFVWAEGLELGDRKVDVAFGGAFYASLEERVEPDELPRLIELGRELKREIEGWQHVEHPLEPELRDVYGVIFWQEEGEDPLTQRNVTVFADGEVDRSPCGSGTSARLALLDRSGPAAARRRAAPPEHHRLRVLGPGGRRRRRRGHPRRRHRGRGERLSDGRARVRARPRRPAGRRLPSPLGELREDLVRLGEATLGMLREDEAAVSQDVELSSLTGYRSGRGVELRLDLARETRGARVVTASGGAVEDLDGHCPNSTERVRRDRSRLR